MFSGFVEKFTATLSRASTFAGKVDAIFLTLIGVSVFFLVLIFGLIVFFSWKYRKGSPAGRVTSGAKTVLFEVLWTGIPLLISIGIFAWAATVFYQMKRAPDQTLDIYVVAKQWMWKIHHANGKQEVNQLHVPLNKPVKLIMTSKDVIHSFFIPAFRTKQDVLPGRYTTLWFEATSTGTFKLFCAEYCGTEHSQMIGEVVVVTPDEYEKWLKADDKLPSDLAGEPVPLALRGKELFSKFACQSCHAEKSDFRGPSLTGLFGSRVLLNTGQTVVADAEYIRESIINPKRKIVAGYSPLMPTFKDLVTEEDILALIEYIKSTGKVEPADANKGS